MSFEMTAVLVVTIYCLKYFKYEMLLVVYLFIVDLFLDTTSSQPAQRVSAFSPKNTRLNND